MQDAAYPVRLKNIPAPPMVLYIRGMLPIIDEEAAIAVVGTRNATPYGMISGEKLGYEIAKAGGLVVSGLARGIDSAAARGALRAGGKVVGVVGTGLDRVYPPENKPLFTDVVSSGAIISEYPPGTEALPQNFPMRNRIMSGISVGVAVLEAPKKSGALITADRALEQGRELFAVPGNIDAKSCEGSNELLKDSAHVVTCGWDIMEFFEVNFPEKIKKPGKRQSFDETAARELAEKTLEAKTEMLSEKKIDKRDEEVYIDLRKQMESLSETELAIIAAITEKSTHVDDIIEGSGLSAAEVLGTLTMLELGGWVTQEKGKRFNLNIVKRG